MAVEIKKRNLRAVVSTHCSTGSIGKQVKSNFAFLGSIVRDQTNKLASLKLMQVQLFTLICATTRDGHAPFSDAHRCAYPHIGAYMQYLRIYSQLFAVDEIK